ncbi:Long-chain-fatty-acid--CoA ligase [compost metagenome]
MNSLFQAIRSVACRYPGQDAIVFYPDPELPAQVLTYRELDAAVEAAISAFINDGVRPGDVIGVIPALNPESLIAIIAAASLGVAHPVNVLLSPEAMKAQFGALAVKRIVSLGKSPMLDVMGPLVLSGIDASKIIEIPVVPGASAFRTWAEFIGGAAGRVDIEREQDEVALIFGTGGTTGTPKLAQLSTSNIIFASDAYSRGAGMTEGDRILSGLPLFHVGGLINAALGALLCGATVVFPSAFGMRNPKVLDATWRLIDEARITLAALVPTSISAILDKPKGDADLSRLRGIFTGSAPISAEIAARLEACAQAPLIELYGMTETSGITSCNSTSSRKLGTVGMPVEGVEVCIGVPGSGHAQLEQGEIFVRGRNVFLGYTDAAETAKVLNDGWMASGDLGYFRPDGRLVISGRSKDIIIRSGHNIDPVMIESCAMEHSDVLYAAAIGFPDEYAGELPVLYVTLKPGATATAEELRAFVCSRVSEPPSRPKRVFLIEEMPLTPVGKIFKPDLRIDAKNRAAAGEVLSGY